MQLCEECAHAGSAHQRKIEEFYVATVCRVFICVCVCVFASMQNKNKSKILLKTRFMGTVWQCNALHICEVRIVDEALRLVQCTVLLFDSVDRKAHHIHIHVEFKMEFGLLLCSTKLRCRSHCMGYDCSAYSTWLIQGMVSFRQTAFQTFTQIMINKWLNDFSMWSLLFMHRHTHKIVDHPKCDSLKPDRWYGRWLEFIIHRK